MSEHFFIVGAQRSGTTYLCRVLDEHPEIEVAKPIKPEPKFFFADEIFARGLANYEGDFFEGKPDAWLRGEKSTCYFESEKAAQRIARSFPKAKILIILRDPIERAISNYWFSVENGLETLPMAEAFLHEANQAREYDQQRISMSPYAYLKRGRYIDHITVYERYFPRQNIKVLLYDRVVESLADIQNLYGFLGVATDFNPTALHQKINKGRSPREDLSTRLRRYLVSYFAESNARLEEYIGLTLSAWVGMSLKQIRWKTNHKRQPSKQEVKWT